MSDADVDLIEFLVRQHLTMSHLSQRRDLADPEVVARFAERVGSEERLVQLYLLSLCDAAMTAPDNLSAWKAELLRDLMLRTREYFRGAEGAGAGPPVGLRARGSWRSRAAPRSRRSRAIVDGIDPRLFTQLDAAPGGAPRPAASRARAGRRRRWRSRSHCWPLKGHSEVAIVAPDAPGVLARDRRALTASRVDVLGAVLGHVDLANGGAGERRGRGRAGRRAPARHRRVLRARPEGRRDPRGRRALAAPAGRPARAAGRPAGPRRGRDADRAAAPELRHAEAGDAGRGHRDPPRRRLGAGDDRRGRDARPDGRPLRDHAHARRAGARHLAREGLDRGRAGEPTCST